VCGALGIAPLGAAVWDARSIAAGTAALQFPNTSGKVQYPDSQTMRGGVEQARAWYQGQA
jgi:hypothetical protein